MSNWRKVVNIKGKVTNCLRWRKKWLFRSDWCEKFESKTIRIFLCHCFSFTHSHSLSFSVSLFLWVYSNCVTICSGARRQNGVWSVRFNSWMANEGKIAFHRRFYIWLILAKNIRSRHIVRLPLVNNDIIASKAAFSLANAMPTESNTNAHIHVLQTLRRYISYKRVQCLFVCAVNWLYAFAVSCLCIAHSHAHTIQAKRPKDVILLLRSIHTLLSTCFCHSRNVSFLVRAHISWCMHSTNKKFIRECTILI